MLILSVFLFHHLNWSIKTLHLIIPVRYVRIILHLNSWAKLAGLQCSTIISWHAFGVSQPSHSWATAIQSWQHGIPQRWPLDHPVEQHSLRRKANLPLSGELRFTGNSHDWLGFPGLFDIALALTPRSPNQPFQPPLSARDGAKPGQLKKNPSIVSVVRNPFKSMGHCLWLSPY